MVSIFGQMDENMKDIGKMENNMVRENMCYLMALKDQEFGMKEKEKDGRTKKKKLHLESIEKINRIEHENQIDFKIIILLLTT